MTEPQGTLQLPPEMSTFAGDVDWLYNFIFYLSVVSFVLITGVMVFYAWKYRKRPGVKAVPSGHNTALEIFWTFTPLILLAFLFHKGFQGYMNMAVAPEDAIEIHVDAQQWAWTFTHPNGMSELNELHIPVNQPVKVVMSSRDVLHSFYVPAFRTKRDVVPGIFTSLWFEATHTTPAERPLTLFCAEYCGAPSPAETERLPPGWGAEMNTNHSTMLANVHVVSRRSYDDLMREGPGAPEQCKAKPSPREVNECWGAFLHEQAGCKSCHSIDPNVTQPGPSWANIWGRQRDFEDGGSARGDLNYITQSIREPQAHIVRTYTVTQMNPYRLSDRQIAAISAYIESLAPGR